MQLTRHSDYALRLLIHLGSSGEGRVSIASVAEEQDISATHLMKIANGLAHAGYIEAVRGRGGGIRLARDPAEINIGAVLDVTEPRCAMVDCTGCRLVRGCNLPGVLAEARRAFMDVLRRYTLADVLRGRAGQLWPPRAA
ncbi:RrF2 family transcriptional regulator [Sphingomonas sp. 22176]|jgi:Rrf2 family nitric oxide-sensitive transcriptional repressor|uniref:RrF2 family transcriptional regulator n=1 Tax=Sphingomonas sp. 22176 TaxID=3453884 RepID=UPI003F84D2FE